MRESGSRLKEIIETPAFDKILSSVGMKGFWASLRVRYGKMRQLAIAKRVYDKVKDTVSIAVLIKYDMLFKKIASFIYDTEIIEIEIYEN